MLYQVLPLKVFRRDSSILTYHSDDNYHTGDIVSIPIGKTITTGIIIKPTNSVNFKTKPIISRIFKYPLPSHILPSIIWLSKYYATQPNLFAKIFVPFNFAREVHENTINSLPTNSPHFPSLSNLPQLTDEQLNAVNQITHSKTATHLLHGITGSGKTRIYLEIAYKNFINQKSTVILVPEISLTSQIVQIFSNFFKHNIIITHSNLTEKNRHIIWQTLLESSSTIPYIIIGPRSALNLPIQNLETIIIDEAHEPAYYQENSPKYSTTKLASFITNFLRINNQSLNSTTILGTATPLVQDYYLAHSNSAITNLSKKAISGANPPKIHLIDLKSRSNFSKNKYFSDTLINQISINLKNHHQTLIFHNRRGSAPITLCENCGWQATCPHCLLPLTLHEDTFNLHCHTCGYHTKIPTVCPSCGHLSVLHKGFGTKLLENQLKSLFKTANIARFDADNKKSEQLFKKFNDLKSGHIDIIIGTQTIAKGFDLPNLATVAVVQADNNLFLPDFSSSERTFQLLSQVIGRVGRGHLPNTSVFIQTYQPDNPIILSAIQNDYQMFYNSILKERKQAFLPPFCFIAKISITYKTEETVIKHLNNIRSSLLNFISNNPTAKITISPPLPSFHEHTKKGYTWHLIIKSTSRQKLIEALTSLPKDSSAKASIAIDPPSLL